MSNICAKTMQPKVLTLNIVKETKDCSNCKRYLTLDNFRLKRNGIDRNKQCNGCLDSARCHHSRYRNKCKECLGSAFCEHGVIKSCCKQCKGGSICEHNNVRTRCRHCEGGSYCEHNKYRRQCMQCGGSSMCDHGRQKYHCKECGGDGICEHNIRRYQCKTCGGGGICVHKKTKTYCRECSPDYFCQHNKHRYRCKKCGGGGICEHGKEKSKCPTCDAIGHLKSVVSCRVRSALMGNKTKKTIEYLGCDIETYRCYLESKFVQGMSWDNYGQWEIDHIVPVKYNNPTMNDVISRLHYTNTQPMWKDDNAAKGNRFISFVLLPKPIDPINTQH